MKNSDSNRLNDLERVKELLSDKSLKVCVIGVGRIGLPTALSFAKSGLLTIGVDINADLVTRINSNDYPLKDEPGYDVIFNEVVTNKKFHATTKIEDAVPNSDVILLSLPTPMDKNNIPDYSALKSVGAKLGELLEPSSLVVVESTIEPGFVENELIKIIEDGKKQLVAGKNFSIGVCPETANPGDIMIDFTHLPRLVGAIDDKTTKIITEIYKHVFPVELIPMPNCKTANAVKLTTNVFRDLNIAFVNQLALLFEKLGIDISVVLEAAKSKYNFQVHYPGPGVGGPCLPVNSYQLLNSAKQFDTNMLNLVKIGREVNESMPDHVIGMIIDGLKEAKKEISNSTILILGISYKPEVKDIQLTPAETIVEKLKQHGSKIKIYDPFFKSVNVFGIETENNIDQALSNVDSVVLVTAHKEFYDLKLSYIASKIQMPVIIDTKRIFDKDDAKKSKLIFRSLGTGKF
ncbi:MAG: nucleotide sugar dehydrogenase [Nitrosopumilus sp.]|uniref:nucleotide sugar dehydrogenase n=1 Tax=Nitrosopumilus sp. TaxID=2024843 RepID=UPI00242E4A3C|nr:nucleotide sugar dehydrogenase [Nitrosopumilus sp.]MCV0366656.1 nucleotide sugar dehydrogenase [Nitrosopumilus sp.]